MRIRVLSAWRAEQAGLTDVECGDVVEVDEALGELATKDDFTFGPWGERTRSPVLQRLLRPLKGGESG